MLRTILSSLVAPLEKNEFLRYFSFLQFRPPMPPHTAHRHFFVAFRLKCYSSCARRAAGHRTAFARFLCASSMRGGFSGGSHLHEKYDWHESQIFRLLPFVVVKCQRFVRDKKDDFLEFRAFQPYLAGMAVLRTVLSVGQTN